MALQHYVNHISLVVDRSGSMSPHRNNVIKVFDLELERLKQRSIELNQETRISIYLFDSIVECLTFDMDVMRFKSLQGYYDIRGQTALLDAVAKSTEDNSKLPEIFGDHAFLQYVITDGFENASRKMNVAKLQNILQGLADNWTTAVLVPDKSSELSALKYGFNEGSIAIWDTTKSNAIELVGKQFSSTLDNYMEMRSKGIRGTKSLFTLDPSQFKKVGLKEISPTSYKIYPVTRDGYIREYAQSVAGQLYNIGSGYYQPTKRVVIQDYKHILVQNAKEQKVYEGQSLRQLLGLPSNTTEVDPIKHPDWNIFVQSTSTNRKLIKGTNLLIYK